MRNKIKNLCTISAALLGIVAVNVSANSSEWASLKPSSDDLMNSTKFQMARGSVAEGECVKLLPVISKIAAQKASYKKVEAVFGKPSTVVSNGNSSKLIYDLTANNNGSKMIVDVNNHSVTSYSLITK